MSSLHVVLCSRDLHVLRAQRIIGFFNLNYPQINEVRKSDQISGKYVSCIVIPFSESSRVHGLLCVSGVEKFNSHSC